MKLLEDSSRGTTSTLLKNDQPFITCGYLHDVPIHKDD